MSILIDIILPTLLSIIISAIVLPQTLYTHFHNRYRFGVEKHGGRFVPRTQYLGGAAFLPIMMITTGLIMSIAFNLFHPRTTIWMMQIRYIFILMSGLAILSLAGLVDDLRGLSRQYKFLSMFLAASILPLGGIWVNNFYGMFGMHELPMWFGIPFTIAIVTYLTLMFGLSDGIEGLSVGQASITLVVLIAISFYTHTMLPLFLSCAALGFTFTFFIFNMKRMHHGGIFLGNSGALPLGYAICVMIMYIYQTKEQQSWANGLVMAALCTMLMPAWDLLRVLRSRFNDQRDLLAPDRNMYYHKLMRLGLGTSSIVIITTVISLAFAASSSYMMYKKVNLNLLMSVNVIIFVAIQLTTNLLINRTNKKKHMKVWRKTYGPENWNNEQEDDLGDMSIQEAARRILLDEETPHQKVLADCTPQMDIIAFIPDGMNAFERNMKRIFDCIVAACCLIVFSPLFLFSYIMIKMDDGGPAIFKQERIGRFGRHFYIYKFRSMRMDAEKNGPQLSHASGDDDDRLTKAGRFLRSHHLDELPQLWNVFCGDMAFIGYRPERMYYIKQIVERDPRYYMLYQIRPGVTSYATLYNGYCDSLEKMLTRLELDLFYLKHRSWWFDVKILFLTFCNITFGKKF